MKRIATITAFVLTLASVPALGHNALTRGAARQIVVSERLNAWDDPYSIRDARDSVPMACPSNVMDAAVMAPAGPATCVCVEANAKTAQGGYAGLKRTIFIMSAGGKVTTLSGGTNGFESVCRSMMPFPALNGNG